MSDAARQTKADRLARARAIPYPEDVLRTRLEVASGAAAEIRAILRTITEAGIAEAAGVSAVGYGPKIASRLTFAAARLDDIAGHCRRKLQWLDSGKADRPAA